MGYSDREMIIDAAFWKDKRVLVTGHTGFKGSWLCLWLHRIGALIVGYALPPPTKPSLFDMAHVYKLIEHQVGDIRDFGALKATMAEADPQIVFHMAAQPLVGEAYAKPIDTYETNVMGTAYLLEAARTCKNLRAVIVVTTDKCYENRELGCPFSESDPLGGHDPYSASKACAEIITTSCRESFFANETAAGIATVRAGNVIGGGDFAKDRIVPDVMRAWMSGEPVTLRDPFAIRPWQEVLEPLGGYLFLAQKLSADPKGYSEAFNFGPNPDGCLKVGELASMLCERLDIHCEYNSSVPFHEVGVLRLNSQKARNRLGWHPIFTLEETIDFIARFALSMRADEDIHRLCVSRIDTYMSRLSA